MLTMRDLASLDSARPWWVAAVTAPERDWAAAPGCRRGARFLIHGEALRPARRDGAVFDSRAACLRWLMANRAAIARNAPGARVEPVRLAHWLLGMS
jgi:hypothetical protein